MTVYRIYKFADRGVLMGGALNTAIIHLSPTHLGAYTLLNIVTALFIRFRITEMCCCIKKCVTNGFPFYLILNFKLMLTPNL